MSPNARIIRSLFLMVLGPVAMAILIGADPLKTGAVGVVALMVLMVWLEIDTPKHVGLLAIFALSGLGIIAAPWAYVLWSLL